MECEDQEEEHDEVIGMPPSPLDVAPPPPLPHRKPRYKECLKNHAVGMGGSAVDGCGEFMAAGADGTIDALKCAACNCHRNFHRKETDTFLFHHQQHHHHQQLLLTQHPHAAHFSYRNHPSGYLPTPHPPRVAPLALPSSSGGGWSRDEMEEYYSNPSGGSGKKRSRTKFSQEQKDKMLELAERVEWRIQRQDEEMVQQICHEIGIKRHVFKVWMHNNKNTLGKKI